MLKLINSLGVLVVTSAMILTILQCNENSPINSKTPDALTSASTLPPPTPIADFNDIAIGPTYNTGNPNYLVEAFASSSDGTRLFWKKQNTMEPSQGMNMTWDANWKDLGGAVPLLPKSLAVVRTYGGPIVVVAIRASDNKLVYRRETSPGRGDFNTTWLLATVNGNPIIMKNTPEPRQKLIANPTPGWDGAVYGIDNTSKMRKIQFVNTGVELSFIVCSETISDNSIFCTCNDGNYAYIFVASRDNNTNKYCKVTGSTVSTYTSLPPLTYNSDYAITAIFNYSDVLIFAIDNSLKVKYARLNSTSWGGIPGTQGARGFLSAASRQSNPITLYLMNATNIPNPSASNCYKLSLNKCVLGSWSSVPLPYNSYFYDNGTNSGSLLGGINANSAMDASFYMLHATYHPHTWDVWTISGGGATDWPRWGQLGFNMDEMPTNR